MQMQEKSKALPWLDRPPKLDGSIPGDAGFDPLWVTSMLPDKGWVKYLQEAEIKHGRIAMLAVVGAIVQDVYRFPGVDRCASVRPSLEDMLTLYNIQF